MIDGGYINETHYSSGDKTELSICSLKQSQYQGHPLRRDEIRAVGYASGNGLSRLPERQRQKQNIRQ